MSNECSLLTVLGSQSKLLISIHKIHHMKELHLNIHRMYNLAISSSVYINIYSFMLLLPDDCTLIYSECLLILTIVKEHFASTLVIYVFYQAVEFTGREAVVVKVL